VCIIGSSNFSKNQKPCEKCLRCRGRARGRGVRSTMSPAACPAGRRTSCFGTSSSHRGHLSSDVTSASAQPPAPQGRARGRGVRSTMSPAACPAGRRTSCFGTSSSHRGHLSSDVTSASAQPAAPHGPLSLDM